MLRSHQDGKGPRSNVSGRPCKHDPQSPSCQIEGSTRRSNPMRVRRRGGAGTRRPGRGRRPGPRARSGPAALAMNNACRETTRCTSCVRSPMPFSRRRQRRVPRSCGHSAMRTTGHGTLSLWTLRATSGPSAPTQVPSPVSESDHDADRPTTDRSLSRARLDEILEALGLSDRPSADAATGRSG